jgi:DNA-binding GntR family transcriptional regulator
MGAAMLSSPLDRTSPIPLYFQIARQLEDAISRGELAPGTRLDNEIELSERLAVSRPTMRKAIERLVNQGLVVRRRGIGTVVVPKAVKRPMALSSLYEDLAHAGRRPRTEILAVTTRAANPDVAAALSLPEGEPTLYLERLRYADDAPLAVMHNYLPSGLVELDGEMLRSQGLYQILRARGIQPQVATQTIAARAATNHEARLLEVGRSTPMLTMTRTAFDATGRAIEYGNHAYLADRYSIEVTLVAR